MARNSFPEKTALNHGARDNADGMYLRWKLESLGQRKDEKRELKTATSSRA